MKKWVFAIVGVVLVAVVLIDVFIPSTLFVARVEAVRCRPLAAFPFLSDEHQWRSWWRDSAEREDFHIRRLSYQTIDIAIQWKQRTLDSRLALLPGNDPDSLLLHWETRLQCGWNPFDRLRQYRQGRQLSEVMDGILGKAGEFLGQPQNVYGIRIEEGSTRDTMLVVTRIEKAGVPTNEDIYAQIGKLTRYIDLAHSQVRGYPMVNIMPLEDRRGTYRLMVAIPVSGVIGGKGDISFTRLVPGRYLITDVKGGPATVDRALGALKDYIRDHQRTVMAIPFQSLITNRMQEPDSSKWVTKIYYPVM